MNTTHGDQEMVKKNGRVSRYKKWDLTHLSSRLVTTYCYPYMVAKGLMIC